MSLRARLVATLLLLSAAGLVLLGAITYATQRSFQLDRIDDQTAAALPAVGRLLDEHGARAPGAPPDHGFERDGRPRGGRDPAAANLPPGVYGQRRDAAGAVIGDAVVVDYGQESLPPPALPDRLEPGRLFTADATEGGTQYRVRVSESPGGSGTTVVAVPMNGVEQALDRLLLVEAIVIGGVLLLLLAASRLLVGVELRPLARMAATADDIAAGDLSRRGPDTNPRTEVGRLGLAFNAMLARLERAFAEKEASEARLRRFLSDASHELRTPLASIRGYAELFRMGATAGPEEAARGMRRIEEEAARMGVLVEDLLTLARLDEVRPARREDVDLAALAADAAADARAADPARTVTAEADGPAVVRADADQLRQVLANLVRNALVHTPSGTPVQILCRRDDGHAELEVRDHGPGLPGDDPQELFERFWRAERGRERGRAGAGLGLAIVAGIVAAHGGRVRAANAQGGGASFVVRLPVSGPSAGTASR